VEAPARYQFKPGPYKQPRAVAEGISAPGDGRRVLDIGCAGGYLAQILAQRGFSVTGIDLPGTAHPPGIDFVAADLDRGCLHWTARSTTSCAPTCWSICANPSGCCAHAGTAGARRCAHRFAAQQRPCLFPRARADGRFPQHDRGLFDRTHLRFCTWHGWVDLLTRAGFLIEELHCSGVPVGLALPKWQGSIWVRALERLSYESARAWKSLFAYQFIVRARAERLT